jgi:RES domain-containing protein
VHDAGAPRPAQESGRWHRRGEGYAQYLSLSASGAWAELLRHLSIHSAELAALQRRNLWAVTVVEHDIADLAGFDAWASCGLDPALAVGSQDKSQELADELRAAGYRGVLSPSAALPGTANLALFGERYEWSAGFGANPDPELWLDVELAAPGAHPPAALIPATCFAGQPHAGLASYLAATS